MNKIIKTFVVVFAVALSFVSNSCDKFDTFPLNIPFTIYFTAVGSNQYDSGNYCLEDSSETFKDYKEEIEKLTYVEAAYRTISITDTSIQVNLNIKVMNVTTNTEIINYSVDNFKPANYGSNPFVLGFDQNEIQNLNSYLVNNQCFRLIVTHNGMSSNQTVEGAVDIVLEAETKL